MTYPPVTQVEQQRQKDAADGLPIAAALDGFVRRKVIKQTVMTTVYGVTRYGARLQIAKQLKGSCRGYTSKHRRLRRGWSCILNYIGGTNRGQPLSTSLIENATRH